MCIRDRFWGAEIGLDKQSAYVTLHQALVDVAKLLAPFTPFIADSIYRNLICSIDPNAAESVHLTDFPIVDEHLINEQLEEDMAVVRDIVAWGRTLRNQTGIKIRQPLSSLTIENNKKKSVNRLKDLVLEELNIKEIHFIGLDKSQFYNYEGKIDELNPIVDKTSTDDNLVFIRVPDSYTNLKLPTILLE